MKSWYEETIERLPHLAEAYKITEREWDRLASGVQLTDIMNPSPTYRAYEAFGAQVALYHQLSGVRKGLRD